MDHLIIPRMMKFDNLFYFVCFVLLDLAVCGFYFICLDYLLVSFKSCFCNANLENGEVFMFVFAFSFSLYFEIRK